MDKSGLFSVSQLHANEKRALKFFNRMQREGMAISAHSEYYVCARGTGKSEGLDARKLLQNVWAMPGSTGGLISPSYTKAWGNTLPAICHALAEWGYVQGVHYFVGRKAPLSANFKLPKRTPLKDAWGNCLHFWNGSVLVVLSFANSMSANSMSLDWIMGPEAKFLNYEKIKSEINPANRGNNQDFGYCPWHHSEFYTTDMPTSKQGRWILEKQEHMSSDHINYIRNLYKTIKDFEALPEQNEYVKRSIREAREDLKQARKFQEPVIPEEGKRREYTVYYGEYDIFDNLEVVGEDYVWQMYRESPALIFRTAFLNERLFKVANGFYSALDDDIHFYIPDDPGGADFADFNYTDKASDNCLTDYDLNMYEPLHIAFDSNASISSATVGQRDGNKMRTLRSFFVKTPDKLQELVAMICKYYAFKPTKDITFYYDHTFTWTSGTSDDSYADTVHDVLVNNNWRVTMEYIGQQPKHDWRHQQIDLALKANNGELLFPVFNLLNNEYLKIAMEQSGVKMGKNGFEKDKTPESTDDTSDNPDEHKTHITDAWDTLFVGMNFFFKEGIGDVGSAYFI